MEEKDKTMENFSEALKPLKEKVAELSARYNVDSEIVARLLFHCKNEAEWEAVLKEWHESENEDDWNEPEK